MSGWIESTSNSWLRNYPEVFWPILNTPLAESSGRRFERGAANRICPPRATGATMASEPTQHERIVRDYVAWANGDESKLDVMAESVDVYNPGLPGGEVHSREKYHEYLREIEAGFSDLQFEKGDVAANGDVVFWEFVVSGTHDGEFQGLPPTGREIEFRGIEKFRVEDGRIQEVHVHYDTAELPEQLGLTFPAVLGQLPKLAWRKIR